MKQLFFFCIIVLVSACSYASKDDSLYLVQHYTKAEYRIPMRDGACLYTIVYSPIDLSVKYPILFNRTPYNIAPYGKELDFSFRRGLFPAFLHEGFIFVFQDVRGRFMSEGVYQHMTPFIENKKTKEEVDDNSDAWDSMDWLIKNIKNHNGRIGMWGISYPGFYTSFAAVNAHPALKCVSPQAPIADWYFDDVHHCGAFFLAANFDFFAEMDIPRHGFTREWTTHYHWNTEDGYKFFLELGSLRNAKSKYFGDSIAFWNDIVAHPDYDEFWQKRNLLPHLHNITPAVLVVGGWYDAEDLYGTFHTYQAIEKQNPGIRNNLVIGPWIHGGWARTDGSFLGNVTFGNQNSIFYRDSIELPFFNYYLKDKGTLHQPEASMFMTGRNSWQKYSEWPPRNIEKRSLYFHEKGQLLFDAPSEKEIPFDEYLSDPSRPVPYTEATSFGMTREYMTDDQRFASKRADVLSYQTSILEDDLILAGPLKAMLKVSTTGSDADWIVKLIDVYPDTAQNNPHTRSGISMAGYQQMVRSEVIRGRYRKGYSTPMPFIPGKLTEVDLDLQDVLHCFKKGHRLMVQIQSTWFPLVDLNPQKYVKNIFEARPEDFIKANERVYHQPANSSCIELGCLKE
jgi:uncharacterized protein